MSKEEQEVANGPGPEGVVEETVQQKEEPSAEDIQQSELPIENHEDLDEQD